MLDMTQVETIRHLYDTGISQAQIARHLGISRPTVAKYANMDDFSPRPPLKKEGLSKLDPFRDTIDAILEADTSRWHKQRHTAKRIFDRLRTEYGYEGSYSTVQRYVKSKKAFGSRSDYLTLIWEPASAQCDFGEADFYEHGKLVRRYYLVLSFPYSNMAFVQLFSGESAECVCQGLSDIFTYIKGIPRFIVFDNATGIGRRIGDVIKETELFSRFRMHHRFEARFCNPYSGHEKGHVENKVDFVRNNMFVPEPAYDDIVSFNTALFDECLAFGSRPHYKHPEQTWAQRFGSDCKALLPLPAKPFDVVRFSAYKTDKWGHVTIDGCHTYSAHPKMKLAEVTVAFRAHIIEIIDSSGEIIAVHPRRFGSKVTCDIDPVSELSQLARKPNAWANSHLRHDLDDVLVDAMDMMGGDERNRVIEMLAASTRSCGYDDAVAALRELGALARPFTQSELDMAARHIFAHGAGGACELGPDLGYYDEVLLGRSI